MTTVATSQQPLSSATVAKTSAATKNSTNDGRSKREVGNLAILARQQSSLTLPPVSAPRPNQTRNLCQVTRGSSQCASQPWRCAPPWSSCVLSRGPPGTSSSMTTAIGDYSKKRTRASCQQSSATMGDMKCTRRSTLIVRMGRLGMKGRRMRTLRIRISGGKTTTKRLPAAKTPMFLAECSLYISKSHATYHNASL